MTARCPTCDREECPRPAAVAAYQAHRDECAAHSVDWRARALAAESRIATVAALIDHDVSIRRHHQDARATGGQTVGTGGPLTSAPPSILSYLDRVVRDLYDERTRGIAVDAARWRKVAPLIERLRDVNRECDDATAAVSAAIDILAATQEPTP